MTVVARHQRVKKTSIDPEDEFTKRLNCRVLEAMYMKQSCLFYFKMNAVN